MLLHHGVKISGARIRTHDLWIRKRVRFSLHHSVPLGNYETRRLVTIHSLQIKQYNNIITFISTKVSSTCIKVRQQQPSSPVYNTPNPLNKPRHAFLKTAHVLRTPSQQEPTPAQKESLTFELSHSKKRTIPAELHACASFAQPGSKVAATACVNQTHTLLVRTV